MYKVVVRHGERKLTCDDVPHGPTLEAALDAAMHTLGRNNYHFHALQVTMGQ